MENKKELMAKVEKILSEFGCTTSQQPFVNKFGQQEWVDNVVEFPQKDFIFVYIKLSTPQIKRNGKRTYSPSKYVYSAITEQMKQLGYEHSDYMSGHSIYQSTYKKVKKQA